MSFLKYVFLLLSLCFSPIIFAKTNLSGRMRVGVEFNNTRDVETDGRLKLKVKTKREKKIKLVASAEGQYSKGDFALEDLYLNGKINEHSQLDIGISKVRFGYEYELGSKKRIFLERSYVYRKLEEFGYVGRSLQIQYQNKSEAYKQTWSLGLTATREALGLYQVRSQVAEGLDFSSWSTLKLYRIDKRFIPIYAQDFGLRFLNEFILWELEALFGVHPEKTAYNIQINQPETIHFAATKMAAMIHNWQVRPKLCLSFLKDDLSHHKGYDLAYLAGAEISLWNVELAAGLEYINGYYQTVEGRRLETVLNGQVELRYYF